MRIWASCVLVFCALAACNEPAGTTVVVHDPFGTAERLEIYIASEHCTDCGDMLQAEGGARKLPGDVLVLDTSLRSEAVQFTDGRAVFVLHPRTGEDETHVKLVAVIAFDAQGEVVGLATLDSSRPITESSVALRLDLEPALAGPPSESYAEMPRVFVWSSDTQMAPCVSLERWWSNDHVDRTWLVPEEDPDCDGLARECDPYAWESSEPPEPVESRIENVECRTIVAGSAEDANRICKLGATQGCSVPDGVVDPLNPDEPCTPFTQPTFCVPAELCDANLDCANDPLSCVEDTETNVKCQLPVTGIEGDPCPSTSATYLHADRVLDDMTHPSGLHDCMGARIALLDGVFADAVSFSTGPGQLARVRVVPDPNGADCKYVFRFVEGLLPAGQVLRGLLEIELPDQRFVIVPLRLERVEQCQLENMCYLELTREDEDGFESCLQ